MLISLSNLLPYISLPVTFKLFSLFQLIILNFVLYCQSILVYYIILFSCEF